MPESSHASEALAVPRRGRARLLARLIGLARSSLHGGGLSLLLLLPAFAVEETARAQIKGVVEQQLQAFQADDGAGAYALASPTIRQIFPSPDVFMAMVRQGYRPLYRSRARTFGEVREIEGGQEQVVHIEDADGIGWTAVYTLERGPDGSWMISGCRLVRAPDLAV